MAPQDKPPDPETRWTRGARVTLLVVMFLFLWVAVSIVYFLSLPTDGWLGTPPAGLNTFGYIYQRNLLGAPSGLQPGDHLIAVEGISLEQQDLHALADKWRVGNTLRYTVERDKTQLDVAVPLERWHLAPASQLLLAKSGGLAGVLGNLAFLAIAALAFCKRPGDHAARTLFLLAALIFVLTTLTVIGEMPATTALVTANIIYAATVVATFTVVLPPTLLRLALVFPRPKPIVRRHPLLEYVPYLIGLGVIPLFVLTDGVAGWAWTILAIVAMIGLLIHSACTMRDALSRAQLLWGLWGVIVGMVMFLSTNLVIFGLVTGVPADAINFMVSMSFGVIGITLGIAILRYRLFDIDVIIRRTLVYGVLTVVLAMFFFGSVIVLQTALQPVLRRLSGQGKDIILVLSTLLIAAMALPLRNRIQAVIDRRFYRKKYDAQKTVEQFAARLQSRGETDVNGLAAEVSGVIRETLQPKHASVWLVEPPPSPQGEARGEGRNDPVTLEK